MTRPRSLVVLVVTLGLLCFRLSGQTHSIESTKATYFPAQQQQYVDVTFDSKLAVVASDTAQANVSLTVPSASPLSVVGVDRLGGRPRSLRVRFSGTVQASDKSVHVCFSVLHFSSDGLNNPSNSVCGSADIINTQNLVDEKQKALDVLKKVPISDQQRNIFASGFVTTSSSSSQGGADVALNSPDLGIPGLTTFLNLKKSTTTGGDPKAFQIGGSFKSTYLLHRGDLTTVTEATTPQAINDALKALQNRYLAAWYIDIAGKMESEAGNFQVTNFVGDSSVYLQSRVKKLFGSKSGFWKFRILGTGFEGGKNLGQPNTQGQVASNGATVDWIARQKTGADFSLFFDDSTTQLPFKRIELTASAVNRYLFRNELVFNESTSTSDIIQKGRKTWAETSLKLYLSEGPKGRFGIRLSYNNGALPPVYATSKSFQFGFLVETADDEKK